MSQTTASYEAADALAVENIALVGHIVRETMSRVPSHVNREDLSSAGMMALVKASRAFEADRGVPFVRYAATRIRGAILDELRGIDWASRAVRRRSRDLDSTRAQLAVALGRSASNAEVASALGIPIAEVEGNDEDIARANVLSLQGTTEAGLVDTLVSPTAGPEDMLEHRERLQYLVEAIDELPDRLRVVVTEYFLAERPMAEIAAELDVSESRVSQIRAEALVLLRDALNTALDPALVAPHPRPEGCAARRRDGYFAAVVERHAAGPQRGGLKQRLDATG
ncbi:DNA-directed RNA polymerase sigma-70 factor [Nocardioides psychrotolerans]|uniref:RNA polymerase sigma factor for flagellar operon FliA n=1 Tax=Nocardioides psychrotolerans TaxID=1005945 RepID=A0A1I3Q3P7_9ACTN|nr:sigma-70 family RNA polymerase sigma factor [Nocardioides psychrotolerans]GEP40216.1 DNA-directed RNA polymerase sigma-70 factor [Nocardioides psychrotolerans]SFJ28325.1 RNA polymerase sigma factor for flagellar operon FliA [Nocardioides psychrotolerans]